MTDSNFRDANIARMVSLPKLPEPIQRKLALQWCELIEKHAFTGDHLRWHQTERERRVHRMKETWRREWFSPDYPELVDHVALPQTVELAKKRFGQFEEPYFSLWAAAQDPRSSQITGWLQEILKLVEAEVSALWVGGSEWHSGWFERACRPKVRDALCTLIKSGSTSARTLEVQHLENPHLGLMELLNSGGDTSAALLLQQAQQALKQGQQALERSKAVTNGLAANDTSYSEPAHHPVQVRISSALATPQAQPSVVASSDNPERAPQRWEAIEIRFLSDERVQIFTDGTPGDTMNFAELGFEDRRGTGGKPTQAWQLLKALSHNDGILPRQRDFRSAGNSQACPGNSPPASPSVSHHRESTSFCGGDGVQNPLQAHTITGLRDLVPADR